MASTILNASNQADDILNDDDEYDLQVRVFPYFFLPRVTIHRAAIEIKLQI